MKTSVVIVTWNSADDIEACLDSLHASDEFEVVVVDNASTDATRDKLRAWHHIVLVTNPGNAGYARANNQGFARATGDYVLCLNPDAKLEPGALDLLVRHLDTHPEHVAVAPRLVNPDGTTQSSIRSFPTASTVLWEVTGLARLFPGSRVFGRWRMDWFDYEKAQEVPQPMLSCLLIRRPALEQMGGLDERFPIFYNDVDLSFRLHRAGARTFYLPSARVVHRRGASTGRVRAKMIWEMHRSLFRFVRKHDRSPLFWLKALFLVPLLELSALARVARYRLSGR